MRCLRTGARLRPPSGFLLPSELSEDVNYIIANIDLIFMVLKNVARTCQLSLPLTQSGNKFRSRRLFPRSKESRKMDEVWQSRKMWGVRTSSYPTEPLWSLTELHHFTEQNREVENEAFCWSHQLLIARNGYRIRHILAQALE